MILLAAGDSFTYGEELSDLNNAWPHLLAKKINATAVVNLAEPAGSNDKLIRKTIDYVVHNPVNMVVIGWTSPGRIEFSDDHGYYDVWPGYSGNLYERDNAIWRHDIAKYISVYHNKDYLHLRYLQQIMMLQSFLSTRSIRYVMAEVCANDYYRNKNKGNLESYFSQIDKNYFIDFNKQGMLEWTYGLPKGKNGHFLDHGHMKVADKYYEHIRNLGWLS